MRRTFPPTGALMGIPIGKAFIVGLFGYGALSIERVGRDEYGIILLNENYVGTTKWRGLQIIPAGIFQLVKVTSVQIPLTVEIPVVTANLRRATFYADGRPRSLGELSERDRAAYEEDPLSQSITIMVQVTILIELAEDKLKWFITKFGSSYEKLGRELGEFLKTSAEGVLSHVTVSTALEHKEMLSEIFEKRLMFEMNRPKSWQWPLIINTCLIGPLKLPTELESSRTGVAVAFAEKQRMITLAEGRKRRDTLHGEGRAAAIAAVAREIESDAGKRAAAALFSEKIFSGVKETVVTSGGLGGIMAGGAEVLEAVKNMKV